jgi:hypothetical protein
VLPRFATLRKGFDETSGALVAATMAADLRPDPSLSSRVNAWMERGFSKLFFVTKSTRGDKHAAAGVGVRLGITDYLGVAAAAILITSTPRPLSSVHRTVCLRIRPELRVAMCANCLANLRTRERSAGALTTGIRAAIVYALCDSRPTHDR